MVLSTVEDVYFDDIIDLRILITILDVIFDDFADKKRDWKTVSLFRSIILDNKECKDENERFVKDLWDGILTKLYNLPLFSQYKELFIYDTMQMINSMYYSCLVNLYPFSINFTENSIYTAPNMIIYLYIDTDLMASPSFDINELGKLREMLWYVQQMARIGNWITTWKRELNEGDFSSGVFAYAISKGILKPKELDRLDNYEIVRRIEDSKVVEQLFSIWKENCQKALSISGKLKSVDGFALLKGFENLMKFHLASEGFK